MMFFPLRSVALAAGTLAFFFAPVSAARSVTVFTNRATWQAAVNAIPNLVPIRDSFSRDIPSAQIIELDSRVISENSLPPPVGTGVNSVSGGLYFNIIDRDPSSSSLFSDRVTWRFPGNMRGFGADFSNVDPNGLRIIGNFDGTGLQTLVVNSELGGTSGFLGIIGNDTFQEIFFETGTPTLEVFTIDNLILAAVPEPGTVLGLTFVAGSLLLGRLGKRE